MKSQHSKLLVGLLGLSMFVNTFSATAGDKEWGMAGKVLTGLKVWQVFTGKDPITDAFRGRQYYNGRRVYTSQQPQQWGQTQQYGPVISSQSRYQQPQQPQQQELTYEVVETVISSTTTVQPDGSIVIEKIISRKTIIREKQ